MEQLVYDVNDIQIVLKVKQSTAYKILRQAKRYQDNLNISGRILVSDFIACKIELLPKTYQKNRVLFTLEIEQAL